MNDWDSRCEIEIWKEYLRGIGKEVDKEVDKGENKEVSKEAMKIEILKLSEYATEELNRGKKYRDTLNYLRNNPQAIKKRNFLKKEKNKEKNKGQN